MVMDATPSPQSVGREFVRQYYTLLNKAPDHLHRFYNNNSSFVHGGMEPQNREGTCEPTLVVGQKQIYNKIKQLNFRDCHAKISQVDAQSTLGNGVVVQVTGELSNDGQPMRRFTQTFVLAAQSAKKYYVHNDIFRYQDLYSEDEAEVENAGIGVVRSENIEDSEHHQQQQQQQQQHDSGAGGGVTVVDASNQQLQQPGNQIAQLAQQIFYPVGVAPAGQNVGIQSFPQAPQMNGVVHDEIQQQQQQQQPIIQTPAAQQQQSQSQQTISSNVGDSISVSSTPTASKPLLETIETSSSPAQTLIDQNDQGIQLESEQTVIEESIVIDHIEPIREEIIPKNTPAEPKTYANLFKSEVNSGISFASAMSSNAPALGQVRSNLNNASSTNNSSSYNSRSSTGGGGGVGGGGGGGENRSDISPATNSLPQRSMTSRPIRERRSSNANQYGDNHQLFLGNVPHHATEEELAVIFNKFGNVVELRIHSKATPKLPPGVRAPQNYGFITYDDPEAVQNCLSHMPLYFPENSPDGQKLNVEEKKTRGNGIGGVDRGGVLNRNMSGGGGGGNSGSNGGLRLGGGGAGSNRGGPNASGGGGGGGMMRGGPPGSGSRGGPPSGGGGGGGGNRNTFNRNDNRGPSSGGASRGGNGGGGGGNQGATGATGGGGGNNTYGGRR